MFEGMECSVRLTDFGALKALVSVRIGAMEIRGFKVIDQGDGNPWVASPSREIVRDGRKEHFDIVRIEDKAAREEFHCWILAEYRKSVGET